MGRLSTAINSDGVETTHPLPRDGTDCLPLLEVRSVALMAGILRDGLKTVDQLFKSFVGPEPVKHRFNPEAIQFTAPLPSELTEILTFDREEQSVPSRGSGWVASR